MATTTVDTEQASWDLSDIYAGPDDPRLHGDSDEVLAAARAFRSRYLGRVGQLDGGELAAAVGELESLTECVHRIWGFSYLHFCTHTADPARAALLQRANEHAAAFQAEVVFFALEWAGVDADRAAALLADPHLGRYGHYLHSVRSKRGKLLSEAEERILAERQASGAAAWSRLFTELVSGLRVELPGREEGSLEAGLALLEQPDGQVRQQAAAAISQSLQQGLRTRAFVFNALVLDKAIDDRLRGYEHWLAARNLANEVSDDAAQALIDAVVARYDIPRRYYRLKAGLMGVDRISYDADRLAPVGFGVEPMTWEQARTNVVDAYSGLSPTLGGIAEEFFDGGWIEPGVRAHKVPHAFTMSLPGVHPYVLLSYTGELRSVLMLAHEVGHGVHGVLAGGNGLFNAEVPAALSETASLIGELVTFAHLMAAETDPGRRLELLAVLLDSAVNMVFRHIAMTRFEDAVHNARRSEGDLSADAISELWIAAHREMLGEGVEFPEGFGAWWSYVPHFIHTPGHEYIHAFGYLFAHAIWRRYEDDGSAVVKPFLELLGAGGSDSPDRLAMIMGIDLAGSDFWSSGLEGLEGLLAEAEELARIKDAARDQRPTQDGAQA